MKFGVYAIRDSKSGFMTPTFEPNDAVAMRNFTHAVFNSSSVLIPMLRTSPFSRSLTLILILAISRRWSLSLSS